MKISSIDREYERIRDRNLKTEIKRKEEIYKKIPKIRDLDKKIHELGIRAAKENISSNVSINYDDEFLNLINKRQKLLVDNGYKKDYLDRIYTCKKCMDTGFINDKYCSCYNLKRIKSLHELSNIEASLKRENFKNFDISVFSDKPEGNLKSQRENMKMNLRIAKAFIANFDKNNGNNLYFYGPTGQGKTFLINCITNELIKREAIVIYYTAYDLRRIFESYRFDRFNLIAREKFSDLFEVDLLIIDDLGSEGQNSFTEAEIFNIINKRLLSDKKTIISSNFDTKELMDSYGERVVSRVLDKFGLVYFYGRDLRFKI